MKHDALIECFILFVLHTVAAVTISFCFCKPNMISSFSMPHYISFQRESGLERLAVARKTTISTSLAIGAKRGGAAEPTNANADDGSQKSTDDGDPDNTGGSSDDDSFSNQVGFHQNKWISLS